MNWTELLKYETEVAYKATEGLFDLVDGDQIDWKPSAENNWMTTGQLLMHLTSACGACFKGFVTGDWGMPEGMDLSEMKPEEMLLPAEKLPSVESLADAKKLLMEDKKLAFEILTECSEEQLAGDKASAPWDPRELTLGHRLLQMIEHLNSHKYQLFYYLKLQGKAVNTGHLWGM